MLQSPENYLAKLKFFYIVHKESISEFTPDLNILLRKFVIKNNMIISNKCFKKNEKIS